MHSSGQREIHPLTSLRFFAASLVVLEHMQMLPGLESFGFKSNFPGIAGVRIFFILSGFIISYTYWDRDWRNDFKSSTRDFYWSRFARIYPLHWLMFLFALPLGLNSPTARIDVSHIPLQLTLTDMLWPGFPAAPQPVKAAWTLSCEFLFYLATPLLFLLLCRGKNPLVATITTYIAWTTGVVLLTLNFPALNFIAYLEMSQFLLGIAAFHFSRRMNLFRQANLLLAAGIILTGLTAWFCDSLVPREFSSLVYAPGALLIILGCAHVSGRIEAFLSLPFLVLLGHASYAIYLMHDPVLRYTRVLLYRAEIVVPFPFNVLFALTIFAAIATASIICFKFYENPARLKLRSLFKTHRNQGLPAPPPATLVNS